MRLIPITDVIIPSDRQRQEGKTPKDLEELKRSILAHGLIHAPILSDTNTLVVGERRLMCIKEIYEDGQQFKYDGELLPPNMVPYTRLLEATPVELLEIEYDENFLRLDLTWQERNAAYVRIHQMRETINPTQTLTQTAAEIVAKRDKPVTPENIERERYKLTVARTLAENMHNPVVANAPNPTKAYAAYLDQNRRELERALIRLAPEASPHTLHLGDFREVFRTLEPNSFDVILTDPPYGINAHQSDGAASSHRYDDSPAHALDLCRTILREGFNLLKPMGAIFMFCDIEHFITLRTAAEQQAFSTFRTPLVWHKGAEGHAPWGRDGFKRTYELILYAVKGQRPLVLHGASDVKLVPRPTVNPDRVHAAEKPAELLRLLLQLACRAGDLVLDPCCGSGPIFTAAKGLGVHVTGIELSDEYHRLAASRLANLDTADTPNSLVAHPETLTDVMQKLAAM